MDEAARGFERLYASGAISEPIGPLPGNIHRSVVETAGLAVEWNPRPWGASGPTVRRTIRRHALDRRPESRRDHPWQGSVFRRQAVTDSPAAYPAEMGEQPPSIPDARTRSGIALTHRLPERGTPAHSAEIIWIREMPPVQAAPNRAQTERRIPVAQPEERTK
jgi:hypothetical protein